MIIKIKDVEKLKKLMIVKGFTQRGLAKKIGISSPYATQVVNGTRNPGPKIAKDIADSLEVEFNDIFFIKDDSKSYQKSNLA